MKHIFAKRIFSMLLALVMVIGLLPLSALSVAADEPIIIHEIKTKMAADRVPRAGMEAIRFIPNVPDGEPYERPWQGVSWYDEYGTMISPDVNSWFDIGYEFEAGRSYYADYTYWADYGYAFADNPTITFIGPDPSMYTYEIIERSEEDRSVTVRYTFTIPGVRDYPDINKVSLIYHGTVAEGSVKPLASEPVYNNCTLTREEWNAGTWGSACEWTLDEEDDKRFKAGETYVHMIELTAYDGYHFSENLLVQKGRQGYEEIGEVTLSKNRTVATITYTYPIATIAYLDVVNMEPKAGAENFYLVRNGANMTGGLPFTTVYHYADEPYEENLKIGYSWTDVETGEKLYRGIEDMVFELGKKYRLHFYIDIKEEYDAIIRFGEHTKLNLNYYVPGQSDYVEVETHAGDGSSGMSVYITYTIQPKPGEGKSASNPVICYNYNEFKYAMENENIRYVALSSTNETLPVGDEGLVTAIQVNGIKNLQLLGDATFTAPLNDTTTYAALLHTESGDTLNISGAGSLTFKAVANNSYNAVIYNQGGSVNVFEGSLIGSYNTAVYGTAIWQEYGELRITGGNFNADNAIAPLSLPTPMSAVIVYGGEASISGGTFRTRNWVDTIDLPYGLQIGKNATVDLSGGTFYGILLPTDSTPLANYMDEDFYTAFTDDSKFNPKSEYSQLYTASGKVVRIAWVIDHVDVHINAPQAGVDINENYFNIPTSGCQATMYYPQWYKNGEPVTYGTFEAGAGYKVVVQIEVNPGYGAEFATGVTAAINNNAVTIKKTSLHWIEIEYDFGVCHNTISLVELTATTPKEGEKPSYTVGLGSDAYKLVGNYNTYKDYRQWYMSSDGDEWWEINDTHTFMSGYYYKFVVDIQTASGYEFSLYDDGGRMMPDVSATVNGYYARVIKAYDQDPSTYITVEYNFGMCNDSVIENIAIVDVQKPVAGERPSYVCNILGSGYQIDRSYTKYYDDWMNDRELYYIKNGIGWWDATKGDWMYENETFTPGHDYMINVYLITENGYEFAYTTKYYENATVATVNGNTAEVEIWNGYWDSKREVECTFTCEEKDVSTVMIYDLDAPKAGEHPDYTATVAYPELYQLDPNYAGTNGIIWYDSQGSMLFPEDTFTAGEKYRVEIKIIPTSVNGVNTCRFVLPMVAYVNSQQVVADGEWDGVTGNANAVYVMYTFPEGVAAPEITHTTISGVVTAGGNEADDVTIELIPEGSNAAEFSIVQSGNSVEYFFFAVPVGTYTLRVTKNGHETYETEVVLGTTSVIHDVTLVGISSDHIPGDVNEDGKVNIRDLGLVQQHLNGWNVTIDLNAAEVTGDGKVNIRDLGLLQQYLNGWDVTLK